MHRQVGVLDRDADGIARRGMIVRHLVLPGSVDETRGVLDWMSEGNRVHVYVHSGFARLIETVGGYYSANMELLLEGESFSGSVELVMARVGNEWVISDFAIPVTGWQLS